MSLICILNRILRLYDNNENNKYNTNAAHFQNPSSEISILWHSDGNNYPI